MSLTSIDAAISSYVALLKVALLMLGFILLTFYPFPYIISSSGSVG